MDSNGNGTHWADTPAGQQVQARLADQQTLLALDKLLTRLDTIEQAVANLATMMQQGPGLAAMAADMADEAYKKADAKGISIDERLKTALDLAERLTSPLMVEKLHNALTLAEQMPGLAAMTADVVDEAYRRADAHGVNLDERVKVALDLAEKLTNPVMVDRLNGMLTLQDQAPGLAAMTLDIMDENMGRAIQNGLDPHGLVNWAGQAAMAMAKAQQEPPAKVGGIFGLLKAINDPDRQKALGFLMNLLKQLGKTFK
ncbi:MAG: DUF1641 domain-containing protein [Saprospiraceae bacterium]